MKDKICTINHISRRIPYDIKIFHLGPVPHLRCLKN